MFKNITDYATARKFVLESIEKVFKTEWLLQPVQQCLDFRESLTLDEIYDRYGLDSLDQIEIIMALEEELEAEVADEAAEAWKTVKDIVDYFLNIEGYVKTVVDVGINITSTFQPPISNNTQINPPTKPKDNFMKHDSSTGTLWLPTHTRGHFIEIDGVTAEQAINFVNVETKRIINSMKISWHDHSITADDNHMIFTTFDDTSTLDFDGFWDIAELMYSNTPKIRGDRAVYLNPISGTVGLGTTVIYNKNWATIAFDDPKFQALIDEFMNP